MKLYEGLDFKDKALLTTALGLAALGLSFKGIQKAEDFGANKLEPKVHRAETGIVATAQVIGGAAAELVDSIGGSDAPEAAAKEAHADRVDAAVAAGELPRQHP